MDARFVVKHDDRRASNKRRRPMSSEWRPLMYDIDINNHSNASLDNCSTAATTIRDLNCTAIPDENDVGVFLGPPPLVVEWAKALYGLVGVVGLCGNSLVIYVVARFSKMRTVTHLYLLNLALADEMYLCGLPFLLAAMTYASWPFGDALCKLYMTATSINQFTGSLLVAVMSGDRYVAVCHPIGAPRYRTLFVAKFVCLAAWTLSALLMVPIYLYAGTLTTGPYVSCNIHWPENAYTNGEVAFTLYAFALGFALPLLLILVFYFLVLCRLRRVGRKRKSRRTHRKVTYLVLTVVTVYVVCWLPYWCSQLWLTFMPPDSGQDTLSFTLMLLTGCLSYAHSAVNPVLYAFLSDPFRKSFAEAFACGRNAVPRRRNTTTAAARGTTASSSSTARKVDVSRKGGGGGGRRRASDNEVTTTQV